MEHHQGLSVQQKFTVYIFQEKRPGEGGEAGQVPNGFPGKPTLMVSVQALVEG